MELWDAFDGGPLRMGLQTLAPDAWTVIEPPPLHARELDRKALLHTVSGVLSTGEPDVAPAATELRDRLLEHLGVDRADRYDVRPDAVTLLDDGRTWRLDDYPPLELAGRIVAEDWCLVRPGVPPVFAAGTVCSPNRWMLADKLGLAVTAVHDPVPGYQEHLARAVDAMFNSSRGAAWRRNWSILSSPERFQPAPRGPAIPVIPDEVWVRSEYETFVRLPSTGWWVFGIQTTIRPLTSVEGQPGVARAVAAAVESLEPEMAAYKDLHCWREPLVAWLRRHAVTP